MKLKVGLLMIYTHTEFHMPASNDTFVISIKWNSIYRFHAPTILLFHFLWNKWPKHNVILFF